MDQNFYKLTITTHRLHFVGHDEMKQQNSLSSSSYDMKSVGVLMTHPMTAYLQAQLSSKFTVYALPLQLDSISHSIRAVVSNASNGVDSSLINALPNLEIISSYSVGVDKIDLQKCKEKGITVTNTPDVLTDDVADLGIGLALAVLRKVPEADAFVRKGAWTNSEFQLSSKFSGKSVGIVGLGRIGSAIAKRCEAFGCPVSYHSRTEKPETGYKYYTSILSLAANAHILFVTCALTAETQRIINREVIDALGPKGILVNIGRGAHVDEPELVAALVEGRLGGAGLDVFENEPEVPEQLLALDNVVLQSHVGSDTEETCKDMADLVIDNLEAHFRGNPLRTPVL